MKTFGEAKKYFIDETNLLIRYVEDINAKIESYKHNLENVIPDEFREQLGEDEDVLQSTDLLVKQFEILSEKFD